jgi:hypothetical protein
MQARGAGISLQAEDITISDGLEPVDELGL